MPVPPHDLDAEAIVLAAMLSEPAVVDDLQGSGLRPAHFYADANRRICEVVYDLRELGQAVDAVAVARLLRDRGRLNEIGGTPYIAQLADATPAVANAEAHAGSIREKWRVRQALLICQKAVAEGYEPLEDPQAYLDTIERSIGELSTSTRRQALEPVGALLTENLRGISESRERGDAMVGTSTGLRELDKILGGFFPTDVYVVGARPGMGKTGFATGIAIDVARPSIDPAGRIIEPGGAVAFFSLEMGRQQLAMRFGCHEAEVDIGSTRNFVLTSQSWDKLIAAAESLRRMPVYIDDTPAITLFDVRARIRQLKRELSGPSPRVASSGLKLAIVDYLQLMRGEGISKHATREQVVSSVSQGLKAIAKEENIALLALSQLNRNLERNQSKRPTLADLRESGAIEQDADTVLFLYREAYYDRASPNRNVATIDIAKQRNGATGSIEAYFEERYAKFKGLTNTEWTGEYDDFDG
jgi:replicative DNA helicase